MKVFVYTSYSHYEVVLECFNRSLCIFSLWLLGGTNWYLVFMVVIFIFKAVDTLLFMKWKPGLIPQIFKSSVIDVKALIVSLSILFIIDIVRMVLQSYTYIIYLYMYLFPLLDVVGKIPHRYE